MSSIKRYYEDMTDPDRIDARADRYVGTACFEDRALKQFVRKNLSAQPCSYHRGGGRHPRGAPLEKVVRFIFDRLCTRYEDAANGVGWEGGYVGASIYSSYDLVYDYVDLPADSNGALFEDIVGALPDRTWSAIDPYGARHHEIYSWSWEAFVDTVKHKRRYFFDDDAMAYRNERISPTSLLALIARRCRTARLIRSLPVGTTFFRCRARGRGETFTEPHELGPPPSEFASQSRMSPAGIPMFYGASDEATARAETLDRDGARHAMATFALARAIKVLDLSQVPTISIFDTKRSALYDWAVFMRQFVNDLGKKVAKDGRIHIDYVPTQIVTEYFRTFLKDGKDVPIDGVMYRSTKTRMHCVALFADADAVAPGPLGKNAKASPYMLQLASVVQHPRKRKVRQSA
jgi:hypothetical protein